MTLIPLRGRGSAANPKNRFEALEYVPDPPPEWTGEDDGDADAGPRTQLITDHTREVFSRNDSPDVSFDVGINPYRGCEHGCAYCFARPTHEYLGYSAGLDFETKIVVKRDAPELLEKALSSPRWTPQVVAMSGVTDPYQPIERKLRITRGCLEVLARFRNPTAIITKNHLVTRDVDLLAELASVHAVMVCVSVTTLENDLQRVMEPRTSIPARRLAAIETLAKAGVPVRVMVAPVVPGLTDHEMPRILQAAADAGARYATYVMLRLPYAVAGLFEAWLGSHFPDRKDKVLHRIRSMRGGKLYHSTFGERGRGEGFFADQTASLFHVAVRKAGLLESAPPLSTEAFFRPGPREQLGLF
ncbi:MAG: Radical [Gemmatimonadetes bacterium]|nr:Radical [Gemmatimonadota bacterium]